MKSQDFMFTDASVMSSDCAKTPSKRKFLEIWKVGRPWLRFDSINKLMTCDICIVHEYAILSQLVATN